MEPDKFQQAWRSQASQTRVTVDANLLSKEVQRNQREFQSTILLRDIREVGVAAVMIPVWFYMGARMSLPWTWYLTVPAFVWVAGFILVDRLRHPLKSSAPDEPLICNVQASVLEVEHQIWLLRNVFWWYILPFAVSLMAFFGQVAWRASSNWVEAVIAGGGFFIFVLAVNGFIYWLNLFAVRKQLEPRRQELMALLDGLQYDTNGAGDAVDVDLSARREFSRARRGGGRERLGLPWRMLSFIVLLAWITAFASVAAHFAGRPAPTYPKRSPFAAVRWQQSQPEVQVGDDWYRLVSLDGIAVDDIVAFSRRNYEELWQKRFEEDLVEVLSRMGHEPKETVQLVVRPLSELIDAKEQTLEKVPMTEANRQAIWDAAVARQLEKSRPEQRKAVRIDVAAVSLARSIPDLRQERELVGLAAMVMVDGQVVASAVDGERKVWSSVPLEISDRWHLGGIAKSITATMIARLIESGQMKWTDTVGEIFPEGSVHEDWKPVTLRQLMTDTAGAPRSFPQEVLLQRPALGPDCTEARRKAVLNILAEKPAYPPGKKFEYSNIGYAIAAAMAEQVTGTAWDELVKREVLDPLELVEAGFGPPESADETLEQPRGHRTAVGRKFAADDKSDNTPIMGPAAALHMSLENLCTFAREHMLGDRGEGKLLSAETYNLLHTTERDAYACGWLKREPSAELPYTSYWHNGSNTMWYALVVFIPEKNMVVAVTSNDGDSVQAEAAAWEIVKGSVKQFGGEGESAERDEP